MPQAVANQQLPVDNMSLRDIRKSMKNDPDGKCITMLGWDCLLRIFDAERNVLDAVGLNPAQIREYYDGLPMHERFLTADGRNVSHWKMFHPDAENIPRKPTEEEIAETNARFEELRRRGLTCCGSGTAADKGESKP